MAVLIGRDDVLAEFNRIHTALSTALETMEQEIEKEFAKLEALRDSVDALVEDKICEAKLTQDELDEVYEEQDEQLHHDWLEWARSDSREPSPTM